MSIPRWLPPMVGTLVIVVFLLVVLVLMIIMDMAIMAAAMDHSKSGLFLSESH